MNTERIVVELGPRSYTVLVGEGLLDRTAEVLPEGGWRRAAIITDGNAGPLYSGTVSRCLREAGLEVTTCTVEPGERSKSAGKAFELLESLTTSGLGRSDLVVALGGGVVGDLAGFVASVYKRGVPLLQVPTTLMSQVDSSIGGKTGVNLEEGKNLVGTFHQPVAVLCDVGTLRTLDKRQYTSGLAEVAKYAFLDPALLPRPLGEMASPLRAAGPEVLVTVVSRCAGAKAEVVSEDERDTGVRAVLNYGHTLGHALEAVTAYRGTYTHGEAVAIGMVFAALVASRTGVADGRLADRHIEALRSLGLPTAPLEPIADFDAVLNAIWHDKKSRGGIAMVLLHGEGHPEVHPDLDVSVLGDCYRRLIGGD